MTSEQGGSGFPFPLPVSDDEDAWGPGPSAPSSVAPGPQEDPPPWAFPPDHPARDATAPTRQRPVPPAHEQDGQGPVADNDTTVQRVVPVADAPRYAYPPQRATAPVAQPEPQVRPERRGRAEPPGAQQDAQQGGYVPPQPVSTPMAGSRMQRALQAPSAASVPAGRARKEKQPREPREPRPQRTPKPPKAPKASQSHAQRDQVRATGPRVTRRSLIIGSGAVVVLGAAGTFGALRLADRGRGPQAAPSPAEASAGGTVTRNVPPGWSQDAAWEVAAGVGSTVAVRHGFVAFVNTDGMLVALNDKDGSTVLSSNPTGMDPGKTRVILTRIGDASIAVASQGSTLTAWDLNDPSDLPGRSNAIPASASISSGGAGLLVTADGQTLLMDSARGFAVAQGLPPGNTSLGLTTDGKIVSGSGAGGWVVGDGATVAPVSVALAPGATGSAMYPTRASKGIVVAWAPTDDPSVRAVALYDAASGAIKAATTLPTDTVNQGLKLAVTDGGELASAGPWLVNLKSGESKTFSGWSTTVGIPGALFGNQDGAVHVWGGSGDSQALAAGVAVPWGITSGGSAVVLSERDDRRVLSAIKPV